MKADIFSIRKTRARGAVNCQDAAARGARRFFTRAPPARNACASSGSVEHSSDVWLKAAGTAVARDGRVLVMKKRRAPLAAAGPPRGTTHGSLAYQPAFATRPGTCTTRSGVHNQLAPEPPTPTGPRTTNTNWPQNHQHAPARATGLGRWQAACAERAEGDQRWRRDGDAASLLEGARRRGAAATPVA